MVRLALLRFVLVLIVVITLSLECMALKAKQPQEVASTEASSSLATNNNISPPAWMSNSHSNAAIDAFNTWFHGLSPNINTRLRLNLTQFGNGLVVSDPKGIKKHQVVMSVPIKYTLSEASIASHRDYGAKIFKRTQQQQQQQDAVSEQDKIALAVIVETRLGRRSIVWPWMQVLPTRYDLYPPHTWKSQAALRLIEPQEIKRAIEQGRKQLQQDFAALTRTGVLTRIQQYLQEQRDQQQQEKESENGHVDTEAVTFGDFVWARSVLDTRAWNMAGRKYLVPGADMFNFYPDATDQRFLFHQLPQEGHRSQAFLDFHKVSLSSDGSGGSGRGGGGTASVLSDRSESDGQQLYESYGDNTNEIYFKYHGFVPFFQENRYECETFTLEVPLRVNGRIQQLLVELGRSSPAAPPTRQKQQNQPLHLSEVAKNVLGQVKHVRRQFCAFNNTYPAQMQLFFLIASLSDEQLKSQTCVVKHLKTQGQPLADTAKKKQQGKQINWYWSMLNLYNRITRCFEKEAKDADNDSIDPQRHQRQVQWHKTMELAMSLNREAVMHHYKSQFKSSNVTQDETLRNMLTADMDAFKVSLASDPSLRDKFHLPTRRRQEKGEAKEEEEEEDLVLPNEAKAHISQEFSQKVVALEYRIQKKKMLNRLIFLIRNAARKHTSAVRRLEGKEDGEAETRSKKKNKKDREVDEEL